MTKETKVNITLYILFGIIGGFGLVRYQNPYTIISLVYEYWNYEVIELSAIAVSDDGTLTENFQE